MRIGWHLFAPIRQRFFVDVCGSRVQGVLHDSGGVNDPYRLDVRYVANQPIY